MPRSRHRRKTSLIAYAAGAAVLATVATYGTIALASPSGGSSDAKAAGGGTHALQDAFASAAHEFQVPQSVLMAVAYRETLWESHGGKPSTTGNYNVMGLTQVRPQDLVQPTDKERLSELNLSGDPAVMRHFNAKRALSADPAKVDTTDPRLHTLDDAAKLLGASADSLKSDPAQSVRGGAALLAQYEKAAHGSLPDDPGQWYAAVARYSQSPDLRGADQFAQRVFSSIRGGEARITGDGQAVVLPADRAVKPAKPSRMPLAAQADSTASVTADCPSTLSCAWVPAAFKQNSTTADDFGNYNPANRPGNGEDIRYIVIHDMEGTYEGSIQEFQRSTAYASAHYLIAQDGRVTQMVQNKDEAWHAANKTVNMHSIGVEHEGYAMKAGMWYPEQEYETSAALVKYLAAEFNVPLDRQHIIGHDEVPGILDANVAGQHWDPGPYWDWNHYMALLGHPQGDQGAGGPLKTGQMVRIVPPYTTANQPTLTENGTSFAAHPANFVYLYTSPSTGGAKATDPYLGSQPWSDGDNWADKAVAGGAYVVAGTSGHDWTAIWYGGQKLWFYNPGGQFTAPVAATQAITPAGSTAVPVFGRAYPESSAYTAKGVPVQASNDVSLTKYSIAAGQAYAQAGPEAFGDYYFAGTYAGDQPNDRTLVTGTDASKHEFYPIRYNHRIAWVRATDVKLVTTAAPDPGTSRYNVLGRDASGVLWQYQGTGQASSPYYDRFRVGGGWGIYNALVPMGDLRADGTGDMIARDTSGGLWYYQGSGNPSAPFKGRLKVGSGWQIYNTVAGVRDVNGDGKADLVGRDSAGVLWLYPGTGTPSHPFGDRVRIGGGWDMYNTLVPLGDINADGKGDMLGRTPSGDLYLYTGTGNATVPFTPRVKVGYGWGIYNAITTAGDLTGDGRPDLIGRDSSGGLWAYPGTGNAARPFGDRVKVGSGWQIYNVIV